MPEVFKNLFYAAKVAKAHITYFSDFLCSLVLIPRRRYSGQKQAFNPINNSNLFKRKNSNTLFILGSGFSLNSLSHHQWRIIQSCDILTFNYTYMVDIKPTYYLCELADQSIMSKIAADLNSISDYNDVPKLFKPIHPNIIQAINRFNKLNLLNSIFLPVLWLPSSDPRSFKDNFWRLSNISRFLPVSYPSVQTIFRASLDQAIGLGIQLNYSEIVLCGVDLNTKYFFEDAKLLREGILPPLNVNQVNNATPGIHPTVDKSKTKLTIIDVVKEFNLFCVNSTDTSLFYHGPSLEFTNYLPDYKW